MTPTKSKLSEVQPDTISKDSRYDHVFNHNDDKPRFSVKVEHNSRGNNWEIGVSNVTAENLNDALVTIAGTEKMLKAQYEQPAVSVPLQ